MSNSGLLLRADHAESAACIAKRTCRSLVDADRRIAALNMLALLAIWVFCNPYYGVDRGSLIYAGRAMADLDPAGVGADMMFRLDGQSAFTVFTPIFRHMAGAVGIAAATKLTAALAMMTSFIAATALAWRIAEGSTRHLAVVFAACLLANYGGYELFGYAEAAATPRPFAESLVLASLVALLARRHVLAHALVGGALLVHPIMALAGVGVVAIVSASNDRRWAAAWAVGLVVLAAAACAGTPLLSRLTVVIDSEWRSILLDRTPNLFPSLWPTAWVGRAAARAATLLIAAGLVGAPLRRIFLATLLLALIGLAASFVLGERLSLLLVLQAQPWRMMWLAYAVATFAAAICVTGLWAEGGNSRLSLVFLGLSWALAEFGPPSAAFAATALILRYAIDPKSYVPSPLVLKGAILIGLVLIACGLGLGQFGLYQLFDGVQEGQFLDAQRAIGLHLDYSPLAFAAAIAATAIGAPVIRRGLVALALVVCVATAAAAFTWDQRSVQDRYFDRGPDPSLQAMLAARDGDVYWIDNIRGNWWLLDRPHWISAIQGAGLVFSRPLALQYQGRAAAARDAGLSDASISTPFTPLEDAPRLNIQASKVAAFCGMTGAPSWIIAPLDGDVTIDPELPFDIWRAPVAILNLKNVDGSARWTANNRYAIISCSSDRTR